MSNLQHELIGTKEASELLGESIKSTIRRVERKELTPATKLAGLRGAYLFNRSDIEALKTTPVSAVTSPKSPPADAGASSVRRAS